MEGSKRAAFVVGRQSLLGSAVPLPLAAPLLAALWARLGSGSTAVAGAPMERVPAGNLRAKSSKTRAKRC